MRVMGSVELGRERATCQHLQGGVLKNVCWAKMMDYNMGAIVV